MGEQPKPKIFDCTACGHAFSERQSLRRHKRESCKGAKDTDVIKALLDQNKKLMDLLSATLPTLNIPIPNTPTLTNITNTADTSNTNNSIANTNNTDNSISNTDNSIANTTNTDNSIANTTNTDNSVKTINNITISVTEKIDFLELLEKRWGTQKARDFITSKLHQGIQGELDCFTKVYLTGSPETWPIRCIDKKNLVFQIIEKDGTVTIDEGGLKIHKIYMNNLTNAYLMLVNKNVYSVISITDEFLKSSKLDEFDLRMVLDNCLQMGRRNPMVLMKQIAQYMPTLPMIDTY